MSWTRFAYASAILGIGVTFVGVGCRGNKEIEVADQRSDPVQPAGQSQYKAGDHIITGDPPWDHFLGAMKMWQQQSQELVTRRRPDLQVVSDLTKAMHWSLLDQRAARVRYLLAHEPDRIVRTGGLASFISLTWSDHDEANCSADDPEYARLSKHVAASKAQAEDHADYAASRQFLIEELLTDPEYRELVVQLKEAGEEVERMLADQ
jgi:hypothetical protein